MAWRTGLVVVILIAFGLRVHALGAVPLRWDEGWSIALASLSPAEILRLTALDVHPPLYYALLAPWLSFGGAHELWVRLLSALAGVAAVPLAAVAAAAWWAPATSAVVTSATDPAIGSPTSPAIGSPTSPAIGSPTSPAIEIAAGDAYGAESRPLPTKLPAAITLPQCVGLCAAAYVAIAPAFVYYAGVTRMYALTTPFLLLAAWGLARWSAVDARPRQLAACAAGALGALLTFYYTGFALAGLFAAALLLRPRAWRRVVGAGLLVALLYLPWVLYAVPPMLARVAGKTEGGGFDWAPVPGVLADGLFAALFAYDVGWIAVAAAGLVFALGLVLAARGSGRATALGLSLLPAALVLVGAALGAQAHMFQARYMIVATPFIALGLGWAVAVLWRRAAWLGSVAALVLAAAVAPTLGGYVYARAAEVGDAWDPAADWRELAPRTGPNDVVAFNILSLAGIYARYRGAEDPPWTYAQLWDPVHEPLGPAEARLRAAIPPAGRLWLVLYKGEVSPDSAALKAWADRTLRPVEGWWAGETLYQGYVDAVADLRVALPGSRGPGGLGVAGGSEEGGGSSAGGGAEGVGGVDFGHGVRLVAAAHSAAALAGGGAAVDLKWRASAVPDANARVFVHAYAPDGRLVAQHDGFPVADTRPPKTWAAGETIEDRHGLWIPPDAVGPLRLVIGLYDPASGERWLLADGADGLGLGEVVVGGE
jgi:hypothetical protein